MSRRLRKLAARIRELERPEKELARSQAQKRLGELLALRDELVPVDVYKSGLLQRIEYETRDNLEAADRQSRAGSA
jgi:hypothetical protein